MSEELRHLSDLDLLATERGERGICFFFNKQFGLIYMKENITSDFENHFRWWVGERKKR